MSVNTLKTLQVLARIGKILSKIVFIVCLVGGIFCILGIISLAIIPDGIRIGGTTVHGLVEQKAGVSLISLYASMAEGAVLCAGEAVLAKFAERYFENELAAGTPFTFDGAKELMRLGILAICIPIGTSIVAGICYGIFKLVMPDVGDVEMHSGVSVGLGVMMIVASLLCKHGTEVSEKTEA